ATHPWKGHELGPDWLRCVEPRDPEELAAWMDRGRVPSRARRTPRGELHLSADSEGVTLSWVNHRPEAQALLVVDTAQEQRATMVPSEASKSPCAMRTACDPSGLPLLAAPEVKLADAYAEPILRYLGEGDTGAAGLLASLALAEHAFAGKFRDVVAACVGAYALLASNQLERMHDWSANLFFGFPHAADAATIHAEWLARHGRHAEAAAALLTLESRNLPWFRDGLLLALDRLDRYLRAGKKLWTDEERGTAEHIHRRFERLSRGVDLRAGILSWFISKA
ncbi:MAG: hypothetical protein R3B70_49350, partial [Polyangiaceae bacterium]